MLFKVNSCFALLLKHTFFCPLRAKKQRDHKTIMTTKETPYKVSTWLIRGVLKGMLHESWVKKEKLSKNNQKIVFYFLVLGSKKISM